MSKNKINKSLDIKKQILADKDNLSIHQLSKKYNLSVLEIKNLINDANKKTPKWFYAVLVSLPIVFLVVLEISLRIFDYGYNFEQWVDAGQGKYIINPDIGKKYFTDSYLSKAGFNPKTIEDVFDQQKKSNSFRIFVLGESSAQGYPYSPMGAFSRYIRKRLELVYPNTTVEVVNIGMTGINSYTLLDLMPGVLDQEPDLILIYTGHNEYYGAMGVGSLQSYGSSRTLINLIIYLNEFKLTQFIRNSMSWFSSLLGSGDTKYSGTLMSNMAKDKYIPLNSDVFNKGLQQFQENLSDILQLIKNKNVPVIMGRLVSNLKDQKPFISVNTTGYKNASQVYKEAWDNLKNKNIQKADSLFRLAKDLDVLRFRAPEKLNKIIEDLGKEFKAEIIPIDSLFNSESPDGIVGSNLIVDHLHPNVNGHLIIGKYFYDSMERLGYLPKTENPIIPFIQQDSLTCSSFVFTKLDSVMGDYDIVILKHDWPYVNNRIPISEFQQQDFVDLFRPENFIDSLAMLNKQGALNWYDAHLLAAANYLRRDDIFNYLKHINVLVYQYPNLRDYTSALKYFYSQNKINPADYTYKRVGLIELNRGNLDNAIKYLTETIKSNPKDALVLYNLSLAYSKKKDFRSALDIINQCLVVNPGFPDANNLKQQLLIQLKKG